MKGKAPKKHVSKCVRICYQQEKQNSRNDRLSVLETTTPFTVFICLLYKLFCPIISRKMKHCHESQVARK